MKWARLYGYRFSLGEDGLDDINLAEGLSLKDIVATAIEKVLRGAIKDLSEEEAEKGYRTWNPSEVTLFVFLSGVIKNEIRGTRKRIENSKTSLESEIINDRDFEFNGTNNFEEHIFKYGQSGKTKSPEQFLADSEFSKYLYEQWEILKKEFETDEDLSLVILAIEVDILDGQKKSIDRKAICEATGFEMKKINASLAKITSYIRPRYLEYKKRQA